MTRTLVALFAALCVVVSAPVVTASEESEIILKLLVKKGLVTEKEIDEMRAEVASSKAKAAKAEKGLPERVESLEKDILSKVSLEKVSSKLKLKGRWAAGYYDSGESGAFNNGSFQVPEAKLQFAFLPDDMNQVVMRLNLNNAAFNNVDYLYLDTNLMKLTPWEKEPFTLSSRLGRFKIDFGEETHVNSSVDSILPSTSAANVSGNDEGLQLSGKIGKERPLSWSAGIYNGNTGTGADNNWLKAFSAKLGYNPVDPLSISGSYYYSGNLGEIASEMSIGTITAVPAGGVKWYRHIYEVDMRYDIKKGKTLSPPAYCDSAAFIRAAYGHFTDSVAASAPGAQARDREGSYGFVEALINLTKKWYVAGRVSAIGLNGLANTAVFNNITCNRYDRYSAGVGYRLTSATIVKASYDINVSKKGALGEDPKDDLISAIIASQF